jgi:uncharacterized protein YjbJ (UPF0337 family)
VHHRRAPAGFDRGAPGPATLVGRNQYIQIQGEPKFREHIVSSDKAAEARKGLFDTVAGKAKEVAGALSGNDELATEGQLQQAVAQARKDANSREAVANADAGQALDELRERTGDLAEDNRRAHTAAGQREQAIVDAGAAAKADAETQAQRQEQAGRRHAEDEADAVARASAADAARIDAEARSAERGAAQRHDHHEAQAADAEHRAAQLRTAADAERRAAQLRTEASKRGRS